MTPGSIGSHRAFMGVSLVICLCLCLTLLVGWQWYFETLAGRQAIIEASKKAETRARDLTKMGLSVAPPRMTQDAPSPTASPRSITANLSAAPEVTPPAARTQHPPPSSQVRSLPLQESSAEVVDAIALLDRYWKTTAWKDRIPLVRNPSRVAPLMEDFYEHQKGKDPVPGSLKAKARYQIDGVEILYFSYDSSRPLGLLEVAMMRGEDGRFLLDWESLVGYGEKSFAALREERPTKPVMLRAYVRRFDYYEYEFADSQRYLCVKMISENGENAIYAYCQRDSELGRWLESDLSTTGPSSLKGYTVQVSFPLDSGSNHCVNLDRVIASRWITLP